MTEPYQIPLAWYGLLQPGIESVIRQALRNGIPLEDMHVIVEVSGTNDDDVRPTHIGVATEAAMRRAWHTMSPRFQRAAEELIKMGTKQGLLKVLYFTAEGWLTAWMALPPNSLVTSAGGAG